jgi:hypothetical protein
VAAPQNLSDPLDKKGARLAAKNTLVFLANLPWQPFPVSSQVFCQKLPVLSGSAQP